MTKVLNLFVIRKLGQDKKSNIYSNKNLLQKINYIYSPIAIKATIPIINTIIIETKISIVLAFAEF